MKSLLSFRTQGLLGVLAFSGVLATAQSVPVNPGGGFSDQGSGVSPVASDSKEKLQTSSQGSDQTAGVLDGSAKKGKPEEVDASGSSSAVKKKGEGTTATADLGDPQTQKAAAVVPEPPKAEPTFPEQGGDKAEGPGFWDSAKGIAKSALVMVGQFGAIGGMMFFLWGVATFNPMFMLGGLLAGALAVLIGGLAQAYL